MDPHPTAGPDAGPNDLEARQAFAEDVMPALTTSGCFGCHVLRENGPFLAGATPDDVRNSLLNYDPAVVNLDAPASSRILTKGLHSGPALNAEPTAAILNWIQIEETLVPDGRGTVEVTETAPFSPEYCTGGEAGDPTCPINSIDLSEIGAEGASFTFTAEKLGAGLYLSDMQVVGGDQGAYFEHPLFLSWPEPQEKVFDETDRFFDVKMNVAPDASSIFAGGAAVFVTFPPDKPISVAFQVLETYHPDDSGTVAGGCKDLDGFVANAETPLKNNCVSCHGGADASAKSSMNLAGLINDADVATACNEVLLKSNLDDIPTSSIFVSTDPGKGVVHPFKFGGNATNFNNFVSAVTLWLNLEKTAP